MTAIHPIDELGALQAQAAELDKRIAKIKTALKTMGVGAYEGVMFRATVSVSERETLDMDAVRAKLSPQFIAAHTRITEVVAVRVCARTNELVAA